MNDVLAADEHFPPMSKALFDDYVTRFEHHLVFCTWCVDYLQQMRDTLRLAGRLTEEDVAAEAKHELLRAFRHWKRGVR